MLAFSNITFVRNPKLVRGLDYYSGTCFEMKLLQGDDFSQVLGESQNTLLAGGRYDNLACMFTDDTKT